MVPISSCTCFLLMILAVIQIQAGKIEDIPGSSNKVVEVKEGSKPLTLSCPDNNFPSLVIGNSYYKPDDSNGANRQPCAMANYQELLSYACGGKKSCVLSANKQDLGSPCGKMKMKLIMMYRCNRSRSVNIAKAGDKKKKPAVCKSLRSSSYCR